MENNLKIYKGLSLALVLILLALGGTILYLNNQPNKVILKQIGSWLPAEFILETKNLERIAIRQDGDQKDFFITFQSQSNLTEAFEVYLTLLTKNNWNIQHQDKLTDNAFIITAGKETADLDIRIWVDEAGITRVAIDYSVKNDF